MKDVPDTRLGNEGLSVAGDLNVLDIGQRPATVQIALQAEDATLFGP
jgi:hypothetical protein